MHPTKPTSAQRNPRMMSAMAKLTPCGVSVLRIKYKPTTPEKEIKGVRYSM
jgi:hypothetical protein